MHANNSPKCRCCWCTTFIASLELIVGVCVTSGPLTSLGFFKSILLLKSCLNFNPFAATSLEIWNFTYKNVLKWSVKARFETTLLSMTNEMKNYYSVWYTLWHTSNSIAPLREKQWTMNCTLTKDKNRC